MAVSNTKVYPKHMDRDIDTIFFENYSAEDSLYDKIAYGSNPHGPRMRTIGSGSGGKFTEAQLSGLGELEEIKEGNPVGFDTPEEGNEMTLKPTKYGLGFQVTEEMIKDDVQQNFRRMPQMLARSAAYKRETVFWDLFNNGFATHTAWDGQYIFDASGRTSMKGLDNTENRPDTDVALGETGLQAAFQYFDGLYNAAGIPISGGSNFVLIVPTADRWTAQELWKDEGAHQSANRNINTLDPANMEESWRPLVSRHLTSTTAWFLLSMDLHDMRFMWWDPIKMDSADDFATGNALFKTTMRFGVACWDPTGGYGTSGA